MVVNVGIFCGHSTQREKPSDSELFVCPWNGSVIVKAYQNLGAKNKQREGEKGEKRGTRNAHGFNKTLSGVTLAMSTPLLCYLVTPPL